MVEYDFDKTDSISVPGDWNTQKEKLLYYEGTVWYKKSFDSFNEYIGWYDGLPEKCSKISWIIEHDKPVLVSEFGAGAKYGLHGDKAARWTEEYQENLYVETLKMLDKIEQLQGLSPWILVDFRSPRRVCLKYKTVGIEKRVQTPDIQK